jgi:peptidoglycan/xylan/chitin deacetylase (PgdA/CDA1 family)
MLSRKYQSVISCLFAVIAIPFNPQVPGTNQIELSGAVRSYAPSTDGTQAQVTLSLVSATPSDPDSKGELLLPLSSEELLSHDWESSTTITVELLVSDAFTQGEDRSHRARLFLQDRAGNRQYMPNLTIASRPPLSSNESGGSAEPWVTLRGQATALIPTPLGFTDEAFNPAQITHVGINFEGGYRTPERVEGTVRLRQLQVETFFPRRPRVLPEDPEVTLNEHLRARRMRARLVERLGADRAGEPLFGVNLAWPSARLPNGNVAQLYGNYLHATQPWFEQHYDLSNPTVLRGLREDFAAIRATFGDLALVRIFLFTDGRNYIRFDEAGFPLPFSDEAKTNLRRLFDLAAEERVLLMPVIFDFLIAADFNPPSPDRPEYDNFVALFTDSVKRQRLFQHVEDLIRPLANHPAVLVWDLINEPENATKVVTIDRFREFQLFLKEGVDAIHRAGELATIGHRNILEPARFARGRIATDYGQAHHYPRLETRPAPFTLATPPTAAFGPLPAGWGETPVRENGVRQDYEQAFSNGHGYLLFWAWRGDDNTSDGFKVRAHRGEIERAIAHFQRDRIASLKRVPYVFTMDDIPMWFVHDMNERLTAYEIYFDTLTRHQITPVIFLNSSGLHQGPQWDVLRRWLSAGWILANHGARHRPLSEVSVEEFLNDTDQGLQDMDTSLPGWRNGPAYYRHPNSAWGNDPEQSCQWIRQDRALTILPVTTDLKDYAYAAAYNHAAGPYLSDRNTPTAQAAAKPLFAALEDRFAEVKARRVRLNTPESEPEIFIIHSTRFARDHLDHVLQWLESNGVYWVAPTAENLAAYQPHADQCRPLCKISGACR